VPIPLINVRDEGTLHIGATCKGKAWPRPRTPALGLQGNNHDHAGI
jgi:hypothetical protein